MIPYTYLIGWSKHNKWYYGVRFAKNCKPKDLWVTYFTSSKRVKKFRKENGEPDIIEIRKTFNNSEQARLWEQNVLKKLKVVYNDKWLNISDNIMPFIWDEENKIEQSQRMKNNKRRLGIPHTEETKDKLKIKRQGKKPNLGKKHSPETIMEMRNSRGGEKSSMFGKKHTEESKRKQREKRLVYWSSKENRDSRINTDLSGKNNGMYGKKHTEETKKKQSEARKKYFEKKKEEVINV